VVNGKKMHGFSHSRRIRVRGGNVKKSKKCVGVSGRVEKRA